MRFNMFEDVEMGGLHHGSGADFDVFNPDKVGSGSGMALGWGFYLTTILDTAEGYAHRTAAAQNRKLKEKIGGLIQSYFHDNEIPVHLRSAFSHSVHVLGNESHLLGSKLILSQNSYETIKHNIDNFIKGGLFPNQPLFYYTKEDFASLIDMLNKLYSDIKKYLKEWKDPIIYWIKLVKEGGDFNFIGFNEPVSEEDWVKVINQLEREGFNYDAEKISYELTGDGLCNYLFYYVPGIYSRKDVSMFLLRAGFDGIVAGTRIYVVFDPSIIRIVEKTKV